jgi:hypothetical protein
VIDQTTGEMLPESHPIQRAAVRAWRNALPAQRIAWHRVTCLNSRNPTDLMLCQAIVDGHVMNERSTQMTITQHLPAYFTGFSKKVVAFETLDDLLEIPFVANFTTLPDFYRFSLWREDADPRFGVPAQVRLMAECENGRRWWVVGRIDGTPPDLPTWKPKGVMNE